MTTLVRITNIQKAVARECRYLEDVSKENINRITKLYLKQLKKDNCTVIEHKQTLGSNSKRVNFFIDQED